MIDLGSIAGLHARGHQLHAYCCRCDRWREVDLEAMVQQGKGERRLPLRVRCLGCGELGAIQVRPPSPARTAGGWMDPPTAPSHGECVLAVLQAGL